MSKAQFACFRNDHARLVGRPLLLPYDEIYLFSSIRAIIEGWTKELESFCLVKQSLVDHRFGRPIFDNFRKLFSFFNFKDSEMNKSLVLGAIVAAVALAACGKKEAAPVAAPAPAAVVAPVVVVVPAPAPAAEAAASAAVMAASAATSAASAAVGAMGAAKDAAGAAGDAAKKAADAAAMPKK